MKPKLIMMIGLPASGKTTFANKLEEDGYIVHSSDKIRKELFDNMDNQDNNTLVFGTLHKRIITDLYEGNNVIFDATNMSMKRRRAFLESLNKIDCIRHAVVMATPFNECIERDKARERTVGAHIIDRMYRQFQFPMYQEGFDDIKINYSRNLWEESYYEFNLSEQVLFLKTVSQHNDNHSQTIGEHCMSVCKNLACESDEMQYAGVLHDFGKLYTMSFKNSKGQYTNKAHFYNHESVSAYDAMFYMANRLANTNKTNKVCQLITYHMKPHLLKTEKSINKFKRFCGEKFWEELMIFNKADKEAR